MTTDRLTWALNLVLAHEGGLADDPDDPGGLTNRGITWRVYQVNAARLLGAEPTRAGLRALTLEQARAFYVDLYWRPMRCSEIRDAALAAAVFDCAVNCGVRGATRILQRAAGVRIDGVFGAKTLAAVNFPSRLSNPPPHVRQTLRLDFARQRALHYAWLAQRRPLSVKYLQGWLRRALSPHYLAA